MSAPSTACSSCGSSLPANALGGLCPKCLASVLKTSHVLQGTFSAQTSPPASDAVLVTEAQALVTAGDYLEPGETLGKGGIGEVRAARDHKLVRTVAVKRLRSEREHQSGAIARFLAEARIAATLEHPGIVPIHDVGIDAAGSPFYTMRLVRGESLGRVLERLAQGDAETVARYSLTTLLGILLQVCDAVAYAHSRGVIHRDLKPDNIMLGEFGEVVVMDWGLAKVLEEEESVAERDARPQPVEPAASSNALEAVGESSPANPAASDVSSTEAKVPATAEVELLPSTDGLTKPDVIMGSLGYMAPEQAGGRAYAADARADIYALGAILYHLLTLRPPIRGREAGVMLDRTTSGDIRPPTDFNPGGPLELRRAPLLHCPGRRIPRALSAVAMKALATKPEDRYPSVVELQQDLRAYQTGFATAAEEAGLLQQLLLLLRRNRLFGAGVVIALLVLAGFIWHVIEVGRKEQRINAVVADFRRVAPAFADQAQVLVDGQRFNEALEKIDQAIALNPDDATYLNLRGNILQSLLRIREARDAYRSAVRADSTHTPAQENERLCEKLLADNAGRTNLALASLEELHAAMQRQQRFAEAFAMVRQLGNETERRAEVHQRLDDTCKAMLDVAGIKPYGLSFNAAGLEVNDAGVHLDVTGAGLLTARELSQLKGMPLVSLAFRYTGFVDLSFLQRMPLKFLILEGDHDFSKNQLRDIGALKGLPLNRLRLVGIPARDLSALQGMPLTELSLEITEFADLTPLKGLPLTRLDLRGCPVEDLAALREMPLTHVGLFQTKVKDLTPLLGKRLTSLHLSDVPIDDLRALAGMPLESFGLGSTAVSDLSPLKGMPLKSLGLDRLPVADLNALRGLSLDSLSLVSLTNVTDLSPLAEVKARYLLLGSMQVKDLGFLRGKPTENLVIGPDPTLADIKALTGLPLLDLSLANTPVHDLNPIKGKQLRSLDLSGCPVSDLSPLASMPLTRLYLNGTEITDITALEGMPLQELMISECKNLRDLTPLAQCQQLERLAIPKGRDNIEFLRQFPKLRSLNDEGDYGWAKTAEQFWKAYDARKDSRK